MNSKDRENLEGQIETVDDIGNISDGYHTFNELYNYRKLYNAAFFNELARIGGNPYKVCKSKRHNDGERCFGGGWFIVVAQLPTGQISNHYEMQDWDLFKCKEVRIAPLWDGHTPLVAAERLESFIKTYNRPTVWECPPSILSYANLSRCNPYIPFSEVLSTLTVIICLSMLLSQCS